MRKVHFVGVGGVGMSALAQLYLQRGWQVSGSDRDKDSPVLSLLQRKGVWVATGHTAANVPQGCELLVYSDAVGEENPERQEAQRRGIPQQSYFAALGAVSRTFPRVLAVAGSHGKTTTTAMAALALQEAGLPLTAIVGSLVPQFPEGSNLLSLGDACLVVEACEYRRHIRHLTISHLVLTNLEWDHTDSFPSIDALIDLFREVVATLPPGGALITNPSVPTIAEAVRALPEGVALVDYTREPVPRLAVPGEHNRANAKAARAAVRALAGADALAAADGALSRFRGVWRRFERYGTTPSGAEVVDDYAHHPTEITAAIRTAREVFPSRRITVLFHPHLYSRTRDLFTGFVEALSQADELLVLPIYPARERPEAFPGVSSRALVQAVNALAGNARFVDSLDAAARLLQRYGSDTVVLTLGAGEGYKVARRLVGERAEGELS